MITDALRSPVIVSLILSIAVSNEPIQTGSSYESQLTEILQQTVSEDGLVDYDLLRGELSKDFNAVVASIAEYTTPLESDASKMAFWINAYNVNMLDNIVQSPDVKNIVDEGHADAFFKSPVRAARLDISLDEIEHNILRLQSNEKWSSQAVSTLDPRIHVALNCAAISCPKLAREAYTPQTLDMMLDASMHSFVNSETHFRVEGKHVILSSLLDWFGSDWDSTGIPAGDYLLSYMSSSRPGFEYLSSKLAGRSSADLKEDPDVSYEYLWIVNDIKLQ